MESTNACACEVRLCSASLADCREVIAGIAIEKIAITTKISTAYPIPNLNPYEYCADFFNISPLVNHLDTYVILLLLQAPCIF